MSVWEGSLPYLHEREGGAVSGEEAFPTCMKGGAVWEGNLSYLHERRGCLGGEPSYLHGRREGSLSTVPFAVKHKVLRLDVAVHDSMMVHVGECGEHLLYQCRHHMLTVWHTSLPYAGTKALHERAPTAQLHDNVHCTILFAHIALVGPYNVAVVADAPLHYNLVTEELQMVRVLVEPNCLHRT